MSDRRPSKDDPIHDGMKLGDTSRNERQKTLLLCEVSRLGCLQVEKLVRDSKALVDSSKVLVEESKKLCQRAVSENSSREKRKG